MAHEKHHERRGEWKHLVSDDMTLHIEQIGDSAMFCGASFRLRSLL